MHGIKKKGKRKVPAEQLPDFLLHLQPRKKPSEPAIIADKFDDGGFKGPIFFGSCKNYHPPAHCINLDTVIVIPHKIRSKENLFATFRNPPSPPPPRVPYPFLNIKAPRRPRPPWVDVYPHKAPGRRIGCEAGGHPFVPDLGISKSTIKNQTSRPVEKVRERSSRDSQLSEEDPCSHPPKPIFLTDSERNAHIHKWKEFVDVTLIGPVIPASLIVTKLPPEKEEPEVVLEMFIEEDWEPAEEEMPWDEEIFGEFEELVVAPIERVDETKSQEWEPVGEEVLGIHDEEVSGGKEEEKVGGEEVAQEGEEKAAPAEEEGQPAEAEPGADEESAPAADGEPAAEGEAAEPPPEEPAAEAEPEPDAEAEPEPADEPEPEPAAEPEPEPAAEPEPEPAAEPEPEPAAEPEPEPPAE